MALLDSIKFLYSTRNSHFAGFIGALCTLCVLSATGFQAAAKLNIFNKTFTYVLRRIIFHVLSVSNLAIVKKVFFPIKTVVAVTAVAAM